MLIYIYVKVDVDHLPELTEQAGVRGMPTFIFFKESKQIEAFAGADAKKLKLTIESLTC